MGRRDASDYAPAAIGCFGDTDEYLIIEGGLKGQRGFFTRDQGGAIVGVDIAGRMFSRVQQTPGRPMAHQLSSSSVLSKPAYGRSRGQLTLPERNPNDLGQMGDRRLRMCLGDNRRTCARAWSEPTSRASSRSCRGPRLLVMLSGLDGPRGEGGNRLGPRRCCRLRRGRRAVRDLVAVTTWRPSGARPILQSLEAVAPIGNDQQVSPTPSHDRSAVESRTRPCRSVLSPRQDSRARQG